MPLLQSILKDTLLSPVFCTAVAGILLLERLCPIEPDQPTFSVGFLQDSLWLFLALAFTGSVVAAYSKGIKTLFETHLGFLTIKEIERVPETARVVFGVLLADFLAWFQHWLKHKVPWFWQFHAVHHSQRQMNLFTDLRFHYMEYVISRPIVMLPLLMFQVSTPNIVGFGLFSVWQTRFYHASIRTNLGPLRYIFVTPQSHRVHHSVESRHRDVNFGVMFSFWDRLFKTQYPGHAEYPKTGIEDPFFPLEQKSGLLSLLTTAFKQMVYPFRVIAGRREHK